MTRGLEAFDVVVLVYLAIVSAIALAAEQWWIYLLYHAAGAAMVLLIAHAHARYGGRFWQFVRFWYIVPVILGAFREMHYLVPAVHPFDDHRYDAALAAIDRRLFGDVDALFLNALPPLFADFLHVCYWTYFLGQIAAGAALFRTDLAKAREYATLLLTAMFLSYLGYVAVPAIGPHHFYAARPAVLDGWMLGGWMHATITAIEWRMPDAFPSGHALIFMTVLLQCRKHHRKTFWILLVPGLGCIWATMALRYHYVVDVLASVALLPGSYFLGRWIYGAWGRIKAGSPPLPDPPRDS